MTSVGPLDLTWISWLLEPTQSLSGWSRLNISYVPPHWKMVIHGQDIGIWVIRKGDKAFLGKMKKAKRHFVRKQTNLKHFEEHNGETQIKNKANAELVHKQSKNYTHRVIKNYTYTKPYTLRVENISVCGTETYRTYTSQQSESQFQDNVKSVFFTSLRNLCGVFRCKVMESFVITTQLCKMVGEKCECLSILTSKLQGVYISGSGLSNL